jgi:hypothetical protein
MSEPQQKAEDEMFCSSCGAIIKKAAFILFFLLYHQLQTLGDWK